MAESFILGGGGNGMTVEHILLTNATSATLATTNAKRSKCAVVGFISFTNYDISTYSGTYPNGIQVGDTAKRYYIARDKYLLHETRQSYPLGGSNTSSEDYSEGEGVLFVRNANNVVINLDLAYSKYNDVRDRRTNQIDIYVIDYD